MKRKSISILVCLTLVLTVFSIVPSNVSAVDEADIELAISNGIAWLVLQQDPVDGKWQDVPRTGFVLIKLQDRAIELELDPFETDSTEPDYYEYATNVIDGWEFLFSVDGTGNPLYAIKQTIGNQDHTLGASGTDDDPDTRVNGYGIYFSPYIVYSTGICLMALAASDDPNHINEGLIDFDGDTNPDTFGEIAQDCVDWLAFAQADVGTFEGGYSYSGQDNTCWGADNSNSGYAYLGLAAAEGFGCTVPQWVKDELDVWIDYIQNDQGPGDDGGEPTPDGGSGYSAPSSWVNELKTGNLIFEMTFYGDDSSVLRFQYAMDYIERHWNDANLQPGFRGDAGIDDDMDGLVDEDPYDWADNDGDGLVDEDMGLSNHYQAMYCLMKGLEYSQEDLLDLDGDNTPEYDWFDELATMLLADQNPDGSWPSSPCYVWTDGHPGYMSGELLSTVWALLTLEKITPPPPVINVDVDIKPGSCPNPINPKGKGVLPVAICGTEDLDVTTIDPETILLTREEYEEGVSPLRWSYEDVATPYTGEEECGCHDLNGDGIMDLTLKFKTRDVVETLGLSDGLGLTIPLIITGELNEDDGGTSIIGQDCVWILEKMEKTAGSSFEKTRPVYLIVVTFLQQHPNLFPILQRLLLRLGLQ